jgi:CHAT domain-containing protein
MEEEGVMDMSDLGLRKPRSGRRADLGAWLALLLLLLAGATGALQAHAAQATATPQEEMQAGLRAYQLGDFTQASQHWSAAASAYEATGDAAGQARALLRRADAELNLGRSPNALDTLNTAQKLAERSGDRKLQLAVESSLGNAYVLTGRDADAERMLRAVVKDARALRDTDAEAQALNNLGNLLALQGRLADAAGSYRDAIQTANKAGAKTVAIRASLNLARALIDGAKPGEAIGLLAVLDKDIRALGASHDKAYGLIGLGRLYQRLLTDGVAPAAKWNQKAYAAFNDALAVADGIKDPRSRSYALGYLGGLYEQAGQYDDALQYTQQAIFAAQQADAPEILYRWQWQSGRILKAQGKTDLAILAYRHSIETLKTVRADLVAGGSRTTFRDSVGPVFFQLADLLLQRAGTLKDPKLVTQDLVDARSTVEVLKGAELQDYFQDDCVTALRARSKGIDHLAAHTAALYPIVLQDRLELLLSLPDGIQRFTTKVDQQTLTREIRTFRQLLEKRTTHEYLPHAEQLYAWIIRPIEPVLEKYQIDTLVIVPDGALRTIPLAALYDGKQFLIARYAIATTPGLTLTDPQRIEHAQQEVMLNGLTESVQGFAPLPYVGQELKTIHALYGGTVLENQQFTVPAMEKDLGATPYRIVHIASHGQFDSDVNKTFLLTYNGKLGMNKLEQLLGLSRFRTDAVELLTLSACQTAAGDDRAALGLAGVAVKAGARSAVATLWTVNDPASAKLVEDFYRALKEGDNSKAKALQKAQLELQKDWRYLHPSYWSAFLLIGNWL